MPAIFPNRFFCATPSLRYGLVLPSHPSPYPCAPHCQQKTDTTTPSPLSPQSSLPPFLLVIIFTLSKIYKMPYSPFLCGAHYPKNYFCVTPSLRYGLFLPSYPSPYPRTSLSVRSSLDSARPIPTLHTPHSALPLIAYEYFHIK